MDDYICDDRNMLEEVQMIKNMTDEEFEEHIAKLKEKLNYEKDKD